MKQTSAAAKSRRFSSVGAHLPLYANYLIALILVLLPFHAVFTTWAGSNFGHANVFKLWKEFLMVPLAVYAAYLVITRKALLKQWEKSWLVGAILAYSLLFNVFGAHVISSNEVTTSAVAFSLITNLRFLWFFLIVWIISEANPFVRQQWAKLLLVPAAIVAAFGVLQRFILPADVLRHFGYGPNTIPPVETVDQKLNFRRIQSTLRGANPLGVYLIMPITAAAAYVRRKKYLWVFIAVAVVTLFYTYSRSAELGLIMSLLFFGWRSLRSPKLRKQLLLLSIVGILILAGGILLFRNNNLVQNTVFHSDETSHSSLSSNAQRRIALRSGLHAIRHEPFGDGPGTAGPASFHNNGLVRLSENYYLQIGQEVGIIGMALFIAINLLVAKELWRRDSLLAQVLLASLVGITFVNMLSHAWSDDTLSLIWWGLAGAAMSTPVILKNKQVNHAKKVKKAVPAKK